MNLMKKMGQLFCLCLLVSLFACSDGDDGEVGPQGEQGEQGSEGPAGTANVIYSDWIESELGDDTQSPRDGFDIGELSSDEYNIETDLLLVYGRRLTFGVNGIYPLPHLDITGDHFYSFLYNTMGNVLTVEVSTTDSTPVDGGFFDEFRYVIIPGGVPAGGDNARGLQPDYQNMSYEEIATLFNIPE
ncbi:MAG: hypothetical protein ACFB0B_05225 [Thermonemataceae bacterium]